MKKIFYGICFVVLLNSHIPTVAAKDEPTLSYSWVSEKALPIDPIPIDKNQQKATKKQLRQDKLQANKKRINPFGTLFAKLFSLIGWVSVALGLIMLLYVLMNLAAPLITIYSMLISLGVGLVSLFIAFVIRNGFRQIPLFLQKIMLFSGFTSIIMGLIVITNKLKIHTALATYLPIGFAAILIGIVLIMLYFRIIKNATMKKNQQLKQQEESVMKQQYGITANVDILQAKGTPTQRLSDGNLGSILIYEQNSNGVKYTRKYYFDSNDFLYKYTVEIQ